MTRWEYHWLQGQPFLKADALEAELAELGGEGWEAVTTMETRSLGKDVVKILLKRPLAD